MPTAKDKAPTRATSLWRSFGHAWDGLVVAAATQRNMRIHLVAGVLATSFAAAAPIGAVERALLILSMALVLSAEAANTAVEAVVDLHGGPPTDLARIAKDAAAGAVLVLAAASVTVFALVVAASWRPLTQGVRGLLVPGLATACLSALAGLGPGLRGAPAVPLAAAGVIAVTVLGFTATCPPCALVPGALIGVAFAAGRRGRPAGSGPTAGV